MRVFDFALIVFIVAAAAILLYRSLRKRRTCSGCADCSCSRGKQAVKPENFAQNIQDR